MKEICFHDCLALIVGSKYLPGLPCNNITERYFFNSEKIRDDFCYLVVDLLVSYFGVV